MQPDKAGTAPAFPADHLADTKADRVMDTKDGLTAWDAIELLFLEPEPEPEPKAKSENMIKSDQELWSGGTTWVDDEYGKRLFLEGLRPSLGSRFRDLLQEASWYATGRRVPVDPTASRERIKPDLWEFLDIDLNDNTASGGVSASRRLPPRGVFVQFGAADR